MPCMMVSLRLHVMCNLMPSKYQSHHCLPLCLKKKIHSPNASKDMYFSTLSTSQMATTKLT